jgi:hypothetical protein
VRTAGFKMRLSGILRAGSSTVKVNMCNVVGIADIFLLENLGTKVQIILK